jgi:hypothetical protein
MFNMDGVERIENIHYDEMLEMMFTIFNKGGFKVSQGIHEMTASFFLKDRPRHDFENFFENWDEGNLTLECVEGTKFVLITNKLTGVEHLGELEGINIADLNKRVTFIKEPDDTWSLTVLTASRVINLRKKKNKEPVT